MKYYLAIDGGSSKTHLILVNQDKKVVSELIGDASSFSSMPHKQFKSNLESLISDLLRNQVDAKTKIERVVLGLAGLDTPQEEKEAKDLLTNTWTRFKIQNSIIVNDGVIGLIGGSNKKDVVMLIGGTGSNCLGRNKHGEWTKAGGLGYLLSDQGSSYEIGLTALKAAAESFDGGGDKSKLESIVPSHFEANSVYELKSVIYHPPLTKKQIASLSLIVKNAALAGDKVSLKILKNATIRLVKLVETVVKKLYLGNQDFDLVLVGGLLHKNELVRDTFNKLIANKYEANIIIPKKPPVYGAITLAMNPKLFHAS